MLMAATLELYQILHFQRHTSATRESLCLVSNDSPPTIPPLTLLRTIYTARNPVSATLSSEAPMVEFRLHSRTWHFRSKYRPTLLVENPLNAEKLTALISDSDDRNYGSLGLEDTSSDKRRTSVL